MIIKIENCEEDIIRKKRIRIVVMTMIVMIMMM